MQNKINFMFILISLVAVIWLSLLSYDNYQMQKHVTFLHEQSELQDKWIAMVYQTTFGVYRIASSAYSEACGWDRQFKFECLLPDNEVKNWKEDLLSNDK